MIINVFQKIHLRIMWQFLDKTVSIPLAPFAKGEKGILLFNELPNIFKPLICIKN